MKKSQAYHKTKEDIEYENKLIRKAKKNPKYFAPIYDLYFLQIFKYVVKRVKDENSAAEITSDIFAKSLFKINQYKFKGLPFSSWLYRIASSEITDFYRKNQSIKYLSITEYQLNNLIDNSENEVDIESDRDEKKRILLNLLQCLSNDDLELIEMRFFEGLRYKEISEILEITEGNARMKIHRVINGLKRSL